MFLDEFIEWLPDQLAKYKNIVIMGDINFHLNNGDDPDASTLKDTLDALGLIIHNNFPTPMHGNTLDILATEIASSLNITTCQPGPFLSDHCSIECTINIIRENITRKTVSFRKIKDIDIQKFQDDAVNKLEMVNECHDIDVLVQNLETTSHDILEVHAPFINKSVAFRHRCPWFSSIIKQPKRIVRQCERIWCKYRENHQWHAYRNEKMKYNNMLKEAKKNTISEKIYVCNRDTRKLYKSELTSSVMENTLPIGKSNKDLAKEFVDFFLSKLQRICDSLEVFEKFSPQQHHDASKRFSFTPMTESEVVNVIKGMVSKSCEMDPIPTTLLKDILPSIIKPMTNIIHISLQFGVFTKDWKVAVIKLLLKTIGLDLIPQNYHLVCNLSFLSKVLEYCVLNQFDQHCSKYGLMPEYQLVYRKNFSCETALVKIINDCLWDTENQ